MASATPVQKADAAPGWDWRGSAAGIVSGITKLLVGHPFDTIKTRMQCATAAEFASPLDCLRKTIGKEGWRALYKGATPPAVGWAASDAVLLGSLHNYRLMFARMEARQRGEDPALQEASDGRLSLKYHLLAGTMAGWTCASAITPFEHIKSKLQMQTTGPKLYTGPIDAVLQVYRANGVFGIWHGLPAGLLHRSFIGPLFCSYEVFMRSFRAVPEGSPWKVSTGTANFISGGLASNVFWALSFPADAIKNRMFSDRIVNPRYPTWASAARAIWADGGVKSVYRGFVPCMLRAFPTNASALFVWETSMRLMGAEQLKT